MSADLLAPILTQSQLDAIAVRRQVILDHVTMMRERFGDTAVLPW